MFDTTCKWYSKFRIDYNKCLHSKWFSVVAIIIYDKAGIFKLHFVQDLYNSKLYYSYYILIIYVHTS